MRATVHCCLAGLSLALLATLDAQETGNLPVKREHRFTVAPHIAEAIRSRLPAYEPPSSDTDTEVTLDGAPAAMRDNTLALPTMTIRRRIKVSRDPYDWLVASGRLEMALKKYPGTKIGNFFGTNNDWAMARLVEEVEVQHKNAMRRTGTVLTLEDTERDRETMRLMKSALQRQPSGPLALP